MGIHVGGWVHPDTRPLSQVDGQNALWTAITISLFVYSHAILSTILVATTIGTSCNCRIGHFALTNGTLVFIFTK